MASRNYVTRHNGPRARKTAGEKTTRCLFCGHPTSRTDGFCKHCVTEGFKDVYFMTGKRDNGWRWAERRAKHLAENPVRRVRVTEMYIQYPSLVAQRERCAAMA